MIDVALHARRLALAVCGVWLAAAAPYQVQLRAGQCTPGSHSLVASLGQAWAPYAAYVQQCPVHGPDGAVALTVVTIRIDHAMSDGFFAHRTYAGIPKPVVREPGGRLMGILPESFPEEPPSALHVTFTDWVGEVPTRIALYEAGESAIEPHALPPLVWHAATRTYR